MLKRFKLARAYALENSAPVIIEAMSYRLGAHSTSDDPSGYRTKEEEAKWHEHDPISRMKNWMLKQNWWSEEQETELFDTLPRRGLSCCKSG